MGSAETTRSTAPRPRPPAPPRTAPRTASVRRAPPPSPCTAPAPAPAPPRPRPRSPPTVLIWGDVCPAVRDRLPGLQSLGFGRRVLAVPESSTNEVQYEGVRSQQGETFHFSICTHISRHTLNMMNDSSTYHKVRQVELMIM